MELLAAAADASSASFANEEVLDDTSTAPMDEARGAAGVGLDTDSAAAPDSAIKAPVLTLQGFTE